MLISLCSVKNSPGVSTAALALAWTWPRHVIMAECDPAGAQALGVFDPDGVHERRSVFELMLATRTMPMRQALSAQMLTFPDGTSRHFLLPGARSPREADSIDWTCLADLFAELDPVDVLADCGRLRAHGVPRGLLDASDLTVLFVRNDQHALRALAASIAETGDGVAVVVVAPGGAHRPFGLTEIRRQLASRGVPVLGELPWDPAAAAQFTAAHRPGRRFGSSPLIARARQLAAMVGQHAQERAAPLRRTPQPPRLVTVPTGASPMQRREPVVAHQDAVVPTPRPVTPNKDHTRGRDHVR